MSHLVTPQDEPATPDAGFVDFLIREHEQATLPWLETLWDYYRNELSRGSSYEPGERHRLAQERGLPGRLLNPPAGNGGVTRREIVIENDIAWRVHALVDFMFGKPFTLQSLAPQKTRADVIETFLRRVLEANGGVGFFQDLALLGSVHGYVDVLLRTDSVKPSHRASLRGPVSPSHGISSAESGHASSPCGNESGDGAASSNAPSRLQQAILEQAGEFVLEIIEAPRAIPVLSPCDYRKLDAYLVHYRQVLNALDRGGLSSRLRDRVLGRDLQSERRASVECTEVWSADALRRYAGSGDDRRLVGEERNRLGRIPVVHIQNLPQPFFYEGLSEVEPLIPLQDELNTRLSDRANRVTFQSFKMYLGKGIDGFLQRPVGPGQMWATDNLDAKIDEFGGDAASPSEDAHIMEIREAMDKASGVTPLAAGMIRDRVGNLTSENALRVVLMGMLSRTEKKRVTYGAGIERMCEMILYAADALGVLPNESHERRVRIDWPSPLPESDSQRLQDALIKKQLGVAPSQILAELGYDECPAG